ncbi:MAG: YtxH domain-containing protein [Bacteroidetes bacterium]|nr:YtxH domain-containing protein [Bacteroidota bacterium]
MHFKTLLNGVVVGVILGVLFAPASGEETRKKISKRAQGIKDNCEDLADEVAVKFKTVKAKANDIIENAKKKFNDMKDEAESMLNT